MRTVKQLEKQIGVAKRNIESFEKKITMYEGRLNNAIANLNKKGANITVDDIITEDVEGIYRTIKSYSLPSELTQAYGLDLTYKIIVNYQTMKENEEKLDKEKRILSGLNLQLGIVASCESARESLTTGLIMALEESMSDFRVLWFDKMRKWYKCHYEYITSSFQDASSRSKRAYNCLSYFERKYGWRWSKTSRLYSCINRIIKTTREIITDDAAKLTYDEYMNKKEQELTDSWNKGIRLLADKCKKFGLDESAIKVKEPDMTEKGFSAIITDGGVRIVNVRVIWAAEYSVLVSPHTRYIATQRCR